MSEDNYKGQNRKKGGRVRQSRSQAKQHDYPKNAKDKLFCERYIVHRDHVLAYAQSGRKHDPASAARKLKAMWPYLEKMLIRVDGVIEEKLIYDREQILDHMAQVGLANAQDYLEEVTMMVEGPEVDGKPMLVPRVIMQFKPLSKLTRAQAYCIESVTYDVTTGRIYYSLPKLRTKLLALQKVGEQTKALDKPQAPQHFHAHFHNVPTEKLRELEGTMIKTLGVEAVRDIIGMTPEDQID